MSQLMKKRFPSLTSIDLESDGNTAFLRAARNGQLDKVLEYLKQNIDINTSNANGLNALHLASKDGHADIVAELLRRGAAVDAATKKGNTALHIASLAGQEEVVRLLVQHGAAVNVQSQNGFTPLYMAAQENHDNVVRYLLASGANQSLSTEDGFTPLAVAMQQGHDKVVTVLLENDTRGKIRLPALHIAAKKDDVKAAKLLLENDHNPDVTSKSGFTPLHIAAHYGNRAVGALLLERGADPNRAAKHQIAPLHVAAKWGKSAMAQLLLDKGAAVDARTRDGLTPLHCAARSGHEQVVDTLIERGAPITAKTKNGLAPLHMAAQGDHVDAARILLYHRAPVDDVTVDYLTALHVAAHCGHARVAKLLLDRGADADARALNGFTPLHIACKKNRIKVVELLLKHGANIAATTESGLTPLHVASFMGCMNIVIYLLQHDANPDAPTVRGETPLHLAARANQTDIIRILLRNGAQVDARAREQQTPLHIASRLGNVDIVMLLLQHGAKVDNTTKDNYTALHIAAREGQDEVAAVLLDNGASPAATTKKGLTPLHLAAKHGHLGVARLLLQKEAPVDVHGKNGVTPLHVAAHYDHQDVALLLLDKGASPHSAAKNGHTPLHVAARKNQMDIAHALLEFGAKPDVESKAGFTPLHLAAQEGHQEMVALLLENKANVNHEAKNGLTPLHLAAQEDHVPVCEALLKAGADANAATKGGYTPLHVAAHYGRAGAVRTLLAHGAKGDTRTSMGYTPLHQAAQQGHAHIVDLLLENGADPNAVTANGQTPLNIAQKLGYITVIETLKVVTTVTTVTTTTTTNVEEKYRVQAPELMHETFMSDSEEEGEDTVLGDHTTYRYLTADEMKSLGDDSLPIDVTRDERIDSNRLPSTANGEPPQHIEDAISPEHVGRNYVEYVRKCDNVDNIGVHPVNIGFLVSFLVDARGGAMRGRRASGVRVIVPPRSAASPTRVTCRYVRAHRAPHHPAAPPLMEGEALASRVIEMGPVGAKFLGPVIIEVPHFAALRGKEREIVILRSDNGESWKEHTVEATEEVLNEVLHDSFEAEDLSQLEDVSSGRITRIVTQDFPQYFAVVSRVRQEVHAIGPEGGMVSSTVVPQVQAVFPEGALTKKIKVGLQAQPIDPELTAKLLGHGVAVSPVVTVEPRRRKFHKAITLSMPAPRAHSQGMINQYSGSAPTLRLLCSITGGTTRAQWEDVTGSTPLTFVNDCVSFTTTVSARFWLMDCRNIGDATKMATELYREAIHVPFMAKFVVFAKRVDPLEARLRVFCMTDDKEDKTLEHQEHFTEVAKSRDVEVLEGKPQYVEFAGNLVPVTKSGDQLSLPFRAFRENRLPFSVRVKDPHAEAVGRCLFMKEPKVPKGEPPQQPVCILNIVLPEEIVMDTLSLPDMESLRRNTFITENFDYYRPDPRLADMSNLLGEDWVPLANQLGLTASEINVIKSEYPDSVAKQAQSMLRMWLSSQTGNKAQTNTLENALRRIGREDIIPQCLNPDHQQVTRIREEKQDIVYRLKGDEDKRVLKEQDEGSRKIIDDQAEVEKRGKKDKYSAEEKVIESPEEEEEPFDKPVAERREKIEKRLSAERTIPASSQRREIVQEITTIKQERLVEDKIAEVQQKVQEQSRTEETTKTTTTTTKVSPEYGKTITKTVETVKATVPPTSTVLVTGETTTTTITTVESRTTQPEQRITTTTHKVSEDAHLLEGVTESFEKVRKAGPKLIADEEPRSPKLSKTPPPSPADFLNRDQTTTVHEWETTKQEIKSPTLDGTAAQKETSELLTEAVPLTATIPQPKPRTVKSPTEDPKRPKSPVRDDLLDDVEEEAPLPETYSDKKKFWEEVAQEKPDTKVASKKRVSISESPTPPIPRPRTALQSSQSVIETETEVSKVSVKERALSFESSTSEGSLQTDLTRLSESIVPLQEEKIMTEYQASFQPPTERKEIPRKLGDMPKLDSLDSDIAQKGNGQLTENTGYISDSEDVEHYISDSEIEDRVPQIRDRMMSVFMPSATAARKSVYERSASLPTEDLYEVSARNIKSRKEYYEEQIRKEMIEEQLTSEVEEEPSPEKKNLLSSTEEEHTEADAKSLAEDVEEISDIKDSASVKSLARAFEEKVIGHGKKDSQIVSQEEEKQTSVKGLAKEYEKQLGNVVAGQRIGQTSSETAKFVLDTQKVQEEKLRQLSTESHSTVEITQPSSLDTHRELDIDVGHKMIESQQSISSDKSADMPDEQNYKDDSHSTKPDSMEVLVDKSEIEDTEKIAELDQELEGRSIDSLDAEDARPQEDDNIPEITITLSGKQKRMSEEDSESSEQDAQHAPVHVPQEQVHDTVWEVSVESQPTAEVYEKVEEIAPTLKQTDEIFTAERDIASTEKESTSHKTVTIWETEKYEVEEVKESPAIEQSEKYELEEVKEKETTCDRELPKIQPTIEESRKETRTIEYDVLMEQQEQMSEKLEARLKEQKDEMSLTLSESIKQDKEDDLSKEESEMGSEFHQDQSDSYESEKMKSESHSEIERIILDSLHQQKVHPEEAKKIAHSLLMEIEAEIQNREMNPEAEKPVTSEKVQVSEFLKHLAEIKGLDEREVELVESVLARRQRGISKLTRGDTQASSIEITDEDLRYSGTEMDYSHILEQQMDQLEAEKIKDDLLHYDSTEKSRKHQERTGYTDKIDEQNTQETRSSQDYESYESDGIRAFKKDLTITTTDSIKGEKSASEIKNVVVEDEKVKVESLAQQKEILDTHIDTTVKETTFDKSQEKELSETKLAMIESDVKHISGGIQEKVEIIDEGLVVAKSSSQMHGEDSSIISAKYATDLQSTETFKGGTREVIKKTEKEYGEMSSEEKDHKHEEVSMTMPDKDGTQLETTKVIDKTHLAASSTITSTDRKHEVVTSITSTLLEGTDDLKEFISGTKTEQVVKHEVVKRSTSSESKSSRTSDDADTSGKKDAKLPEVVMRKHASDTDSSSAALKPDRKSAIEFEAYSSSGESHYQSFEIDSAKSRPCSSDVEGLVAAAGSSEYESALTSQDYSAKSHMTHTDYHTAISSISSKDSMKSLDSESSGNLASVEVSEHSETLVPSTSDLEDILDPNDQQLLDDGEQSSACSGQSMPVQRSLDASDSDIPSYTGIGESVDISEDEPSDLKASEVATKMKRSCEMTFQPEPKEFVPDSPQGEGEEKLGTSLDEGSILSMSVSSTTSSTGAQRTVIELSRADSERHEGSMTVSGTSEHLSMDDVEMMIGSRESLITPPALHAIDISTSTASFDAPITSVTISTSAIDENGSHSVSTQVTSEARVVTQKADEPKKRGHRRNESTFTSAMISSSTRTEIERKYHSDLAESDKYTSNLSFKESSSDEKKDVDEAEKEESYETEADQGLHRDIREGKYTETESDVELDTSRPQSRFSKSDSERPTSDERMESELADLVKSSDVTEITDPIERPTTPEPSGTPEARASVSDLEQELSSEIIKPREVHIPEGRRSFSGIAEVYPHHLEKRDSHGKSSSTSSEKSSFEEAEAEAVFGMVAHVSPAHKIKQIVPIPEDADAEDHEVQAKERAQKEFEERQRALKDVSPGFVPDIKITQHMQPLMDESFTYPDLELEAKEKKMEQEAAITVDTPQTPSSKSSEETDQGREYVLDGSVSTIPEEPEGISDDKILSESKSEAGTAIEATLKDGSERGTDSPESDSFEMLEKPDIIDDFVVIEEVGKEAQEQDTEGKSVKIGLIPKRPKKHDEEVEKYLAHSAPTPLESKMTDVKYYPEGSSSEELGFDFEESPPLDIQNGAGKPPSSVEYGHQYDRELEANRKWIEQQFQGDQAALIAAGYGYEMEFERGPLEDIKEEDINDLAASSYGSHRESGGSLKESYSSTPEYDVLAGRKYFTRSAEHDDVSMSSLQEFENLEKAMSLEMKKFHHGSQDSSSNGSFKTRYSAGKGGQGDDISVSSLKEFEGLEKACIAAHKIEIKVKEEEAMLAQIDEGPESIVSESESSQATSDKKVTADTEEDEDYEKRMFEIDEIIRQAQTNVERFVDLKEMEKTESLGRGDSVEEVSRVPDLDLDAPLVKSTIKVQWKESDDVMITSTDSLDLKEKPSHHDSTDSLDQKTGIDIMTASTDSIEFQAQKSKDNIMSDSIEIKGEEKSYMVSSDSLELAAATSSGNILLTDSIDEDCGKIVHDHSSSSTGKDFSSSTKDEIEQDIKTDYMLESTESVDVTSSTATHATYQYDTDSIFSGSFTSGGSNTMVSSTTSLDQNRQAAASVDVAAAVRKVWFDEEVDGRRTTDYVDDYSKPYVTEVIEPSDDERFSHTIHRKVELPPEVRRVTFTGADADERLKQFMKDFNEGEECFESEETDEFGNVHVRKVVQRKFIVKSGEGEDKPMSGPEIEEYFRQLNQQKVMPDQGVISKTEGRGVITKTITDGQGTTTITQQFDLPSTQLTTLTKTGGEVAASSSASVSASARDVTTSAKAEGEESLEKEEAGKDSRKVADQHQLSDEMKELLKELEKESKQ